MANSGYRSYARAMREAVISVRGETSLELRIRILERAAARALGRGGPSAKELDQVVDQIAKQPGLVDVTGLLARGYSEDSVYEIVVTAAVGAGLACAEPALAALREIDP